MCCATNSVPAACETIKKNLPEEVAYLESFDSFAEDVQSIVDLPSRTVDLLVRFLKQNGGALSRRARQGEFSALRADEVQRIEALYAAAFGEVGGTATG